MQVAKLQPGDLRTNLERCDQEIVLSCLDRNPKTRLSAAQVTIGPSVVSTGRLINAVDF